MNVQDLGSIGELIAAVATVGTLIYLAFQIRANTRATRSSAYQAIGQGFSDMTWDMAKDPELLQLVEMMWDDYDNTELTPDQQRKLDTAWRALFINQENLFLQHKEGTIPESYWLGKSVTIQMHLRTQRSRDWWAGNCWHFDPDFQLVVEEMIRSNQNDA